MAILHNSQPVMGVVIVDDDRPMYNGLPVLGGRWASGGAKFTGGRIVTGVEQVTDARSIHNGQPVRGVAIVEGEFWNHQPVLIMDDLTLSYTGSGYAGSVYSAAKAGQWYADGVAISGATGSTWTMTSAHEGKVIRCGDSMTVQKWVPAVLGAKLRGNLVADMGVTQSGGKVSSWAPRAGLVTSPCLQTTASYQPSTGATIGGMAALQFSASRMSLPAMTGAPAEGTAVLMALQYATDDTSNQCVFGNNAGWNSPSQWGYEYRPTGGAGNEHRFTALPFGQASMNTITTNFGPRCFMSGVVGGVLYHSWGPEQNSRALDPAPSVTLPNTDIGAYSNTSSMTAKLGEVIVLIGATLGDIEACKNYINLKYGAA